MLKVNSLYRCAFLVIVLCVGLLHQAHAQVSPKASPLIIAHRGGAKEFAENTIAAFQRAVRLGADGNEMDLRLTRDGVVVVYHDEIFGRVEGLPKMQQNTAIAVMTYDEMRRSSIVGPRDDNGRYYAPTLQEVLAQVKIGLLNIELKRCPKFDELVDKTIAILKGFAELDRVVLEPPDLKTAKKLRDELGTRLKLHLNPRSDKTIPFDEALEKVLKFKPHSLSIHYTEISLKLVDRAHLAGVEVWAWTLDNPAMAQALAVMHIDAIKTDTPTALLNALKKRQ